jgi:catechol 2,3-dioxygenase-like lactoylglutathione lyase family enzyme
MDLTVSHVFLTVDDQDKALEFYHGVLGLAVLNDVQFDEMRWVSVGSPDQPGVEIVLLPPLGPVASERDVILDLMRKGGMNGLIFRTGNLDKTFEVLLAAGAEVTQEPIDQPYGVRDCGFRDPFGNMLRFSEPNQPA